MVVPPKYFFHAINVQTISRVQHLLKIEQTLTVSEILPFFIFRINRRWPPKFEKKNQFFPYGSKISTKSLDLARLRRYKQFCVLPFLAKIQNDRHFWGGENFLKIANNTFLRYPVGRIDEIALSRTVKEIQAILCFPIFGKNSKIQNGHHFWGGEIFLKIDISTFLRYPEGQKF